jgi:two-component system chemotaxis response regulator CheY
MVDRDGPLDLTILLQHRRIQMRTQAEAALTAAGCTVHVSSDGIQGLTQLMYLRAVPILVMSANTSPVLKTRARNIGASGWLRDPFSKEQLMAAIRAAVPVTGEG